MLGKGWSDDAVLVRNQVSVPSLLFLAVGLIEHWHSSAGEAPFRTPGRTAGEARSRLAGGFDPHAQLEISRRREGRQLSCRRGATRPLVPGPWHPSRRRR